MSNAHASVWVLGDQLLVRHPAPLAAEQAYTRANLCIVLPESGVRTERLPYQRKRLVLGFCAMRHYTEGLRQQGQAVEERKTPRKCQSQTNRSGLLTPKPRFLRQARNPG